MNGAADSIHVLHVDDDASLGDVVAEHLEREDDRLTVETASGASEGLEYVADNDVDCVVSDYDMPGWNGIEFLRAVREDYPDLPFVLFTGAGSEAVASEAISAGVTDYLQKGGGPSKYAVLAHRIGNAVEQYRSERAIEDTERKLSQLAERSEDVLFMFSGDWSDLLFVNSAYEDIWGAPVSELEADPSSFLDYVHPTDRDDVVDAMERLSNGDPEEIEYRVIPDGDGDRRWVRVQSSPIFDDGTVDRIVGYARDVTDRMERERELERYETIVETTEDGIYVFDADGRFEFVNQRVVDVSGIPLDGWIGEHVSIHTDLQTLSEAEVAAIEAGIDAIVSGEEDEVRVELSPDVPSDVRELELRLTPFDADGGSVIGFSRDITERKAKQRQLRRKNERLAEFANMVSHDLRNPLEVATLRLEQAQQECDSEHLAELEWGLDQMERLIGDLLTLARQGEQVDEVDAVDLADVAEECWRNVSTADATLVVDTERTVLADQQRLRQLLENLVRNAIQHGGDDVTVTVGDLESGFYVADDGPGIPEDERDNVFEIGYSTADDGTGFGLNIVREIADAHDWAIRVTDSEAGGARFEITGVEVPDG